MSFIEKLRSRSPEAKQTVAFGSALAVTLAVALVWITTLPARFNETGEVPVEEKVEQAAVAQEDKKGFGETLSNTLSDVKAQFGAVAESFKRISTESEENTPEEVAPEVEAEGEMRMEAETPEAPESPKRVILIGTSTDKQNQQ